MNFFRKKNVDSVINLLIFKPKKRWGHHINAVLKANYVSIEPVIFELFTQYLDLEGTYTDIVQINWSINLFINYIHIDWCITVIIV